MYSRQTVILGKHSRREPAYYRTLPSGWILRFRIMTPVPCVFGKTDSYTADLSLVSQAEQLGSLPLTETRRRIYATQKGAASGS